MKRSKGARRLAALAAVLACALAAMAFVPRNAWAQTAENMHNGLIQLFQISASYIYLVLTVALGVAAFAFVGVAAICRKSGQLN